MFGVFFIATSWGRQNGGINSINYSLIKNYAKIINKDDWNVYCILTDEKVDSDTISYVLETHNITLINTKTPVTSTTIKKIIKENNYEQLFFIGHDIITGKFANDLRDTYDNSVSIVLHHMYYQSYYYSRELDPEKIRQKEDLQKSIIPFADIVVAVGPLLKETAMDLCIDARKDPDIYDIVPGLEEIEPIPQIHHKHTILLFGRLEERNNGVKQIGLAIDAIAEYLKDYDKDYVIKCYGYADDSEKNQKQLLAQAFEKADKSVNIRANSYINNEEKLREEIARASLCIMPSYFEGFGLTAYEAISAGVPVIISRNTGLYRFLNDKHGESIDHLFQSLNIKGNPVDIEKAYTSEDLSSLKVCIENVFKNYEKSKNQALELRTKLLDSHCTWEYTARNFAEIIESKIEKKPVPFQFKHNIKNTENKTRINLSNYIVESLIFNYCKNFCDPHKIVFKIIKYSNGGTRRFTVFSSDEDFDKINQQLKIRPINDGTVGILNREFNTYKNEFPIIVSNFTDSTCFCVTQSNITQISNATPGIPDHHVLSIIAVPIIHKNNIVGSITLDIYDEKFIKEISKNREAVFRNLYNTLSLLSEELKSRFYFDIKDNINFIEVNNMLNRREIVSFNGPCPLDCKHCFAKEIINTDENENEIQDIIDSLSSKTFDVIYISHYKENFYNADKGVSLCEELYKSYQCDICVTTRCIITSEALNRIKKLNDIMIENGNKLTFCISIPAYDSYHKFENRAIIPTPQQRIDFAGQLKNLNISSIVTIRPMFPSSIVPQEEIHKIVDSCVNKVDAILTGGLYVSDDILQRLHLSSSDLSFLGTSDSDYLVGVEKNFKAVDVNAEIEELEKYCKNNNVPFFRHSMDALNYLK